MAKAIAGISDLNISEKVAVGKDRVMALTGNTVINPDPVKLTDYTKAVNDLQNAQSEVGNAQINLNEKYSRQSDAEKEYDRQTKRMVSEINSLTEEGSKLSASGFPLASKGGEEFPPVIPAPLNVKASMGKKSGEVNVKWKSVRYSQGYLLQYGNDPAFPDSTTKTEHLGRISKTVLSGLETGTKIWVRVLALKGTGKGPWSDVSLTLVP